MTIDKGMRALKQDMIENALRYPDLKDAYDLAVRALKQYADESSWDEELGVLWTDTHEGYALARQTLEDLGEDF